MIGRCNATPKGVKTRPYHAGRGIKVCDRWLSSFEAFLADMGERPSLAHWIERENGDRDYEPSNCCWATASEQANNRRSNRIIEVFGERMNVTQAAKKFGIDRSRLFAGLRSGKSPEQAITRLLQQQKASA